MEDKIRGSLFGYRKKDVTTYIGDTVSEYENKISELTGDVSAAKKQIETLLAENNKLFERVTLLESEREVVSKAVISAEQRAEKIVKDSEKRAEEIQMAKEKELADADEELERIKSQIRTIKLNAIAAVRKFEDDIDKENN